MHFQQASILPAALISLLLVPSSILVSAASHRSMCVRENALLLADAADCGDHDSLQSCFLNVLNYVDLVDLERCFVDAGCAIAESTSEALHVVENCDEGTTSSRNAAELRRRGPEALPGPTPAPVPAPQDAAQTPAPTPSESGRPAVCSTAREFATTVCPVSSVGPDKFTHLPCTSTTLSTMQCAATNVCFEDGGCIFRDDTVGLSGIIVGVILAVFTTATIAAICFLCIRDKSERRKAHKKLESDNEARSRADDLKKRQEAAAERNESNPFLG